MAGPWETYAAPHPATLFQTAGSGPKPATNYALAGSAAAAAPLTYIPGSEADPTVISRNEAIKKGIDVAGTLRTQANSAGLERANTMARIAAEQQAGLAKLNYEQGLKRNQPVSGEEKAKAIAGYTTANQLQDYVSQLRSLYAQGPGATKGLAGIGDYLPTTINRRFDSAGNAARGLVGQALGFTGGQLNTAREAEMAVGPFLPQAADRDEVIQDKIARLQGLVDQAHQRSVSQLGGVPDQNGNVVPLSSPAASTVHAANIAAIGNAGPGNPPSGGGQGGGSPPAAPTGGNSFTPNPVSPAAQTSLATGSNRTEHDQRAEALIEQLVRSGSNAEQINGALKAIGVDPGTTVNQDQVSQTQAYLKTHPNYSGFASSTRQVPNSLLAQAAASPVGAFAANAADAVVPLNLLSSDAKQGISALQQAHPYASFAGTLAGGIPAAAGAEVAATRLLPGAGVGAARLADAGYGAYQGFGNADQGQGLTGAAVGAGAGLLGGMFGRGVTSGVGKGLRGVANADVGYLTKEGVPLTVGQALSGSGTIGRAVKGVEDRLTGIAGLGNIINARRGEGIDAYNTAAFRQGTAPLAQQTNPINAAPQDIGALGIEQLRGINGQGYTNAYSGRSAVADPTFDASYASSLSAANAIPNTGPTVKSEIDSIVPGYFSQGPQVGSRQESAYPGVVGGLPRMGVAPAFRGQDGKLYVGSAQGSHFTAITPELRSVGIGGTGFADNQGNFYNRNDALSFVNKNGEGIKPSETMAGELDALDYREQSPYAHMPAQPAFRDIPVYGPGTIKGEDAAAAIRELKGLRSARKTDALGARTGDVVRGTEGAITDLFDRQAPGFTNDLSQANRVNTNLKVLEKAVQAGKNTDERFLPSQLNTASVQSGNAYGGTGATTARPFYDLAMAGQNVLPSKVPDSGTAGRLAMLALPGVLGGAGGIGYASGGAEGAGDATASTLGLGALLAAGGTRTGQKLLTRALLDRPDAAVDWGNALIRKKAIGGMFGAGVGASLPTILGF